MSEITLHKGTGDIVAKTEGRIDVEWKIHDFFSLKPDTDSRFESPAFQFLDALWCLQVDPNGQTTYKSAGWTGLYLKKVHSVTAEHTVIGELGVLHENGLIYTSSHIKETFVGNESKWGTSQLVNRATLLKFIDNNFPHDYIMFFCKIQGETKKNAGAISLEIKMKERILENSDDPLRLLSRSFKDLLLSQRGSDVVLQVKDHELPAHKTILEARSSVFAKMFEHDMLENQTRTIKIPDFEPEIIQHLLRYIYSAETEGFSPENICQLYKAADKYDLEKLREKCAEYIETNVTIENFCDVLLLANLYQEQKIKVIARDFIALNKHDVLSSDSWKLLVEENKSMAYDMLESIMLSYNMKLKK